MNPATPTNSTAFTKICSKPTEVATRLFALGVQEQLLVQAVQEGQAHVYACTNHDPPAGRGFIGWMKTVRALRDLLVPASGWKPSDRGNYSIVVHPTGTWAIQVASGTADTGVVEGSPTNRSPKGLYTKLAVEQNQQPHFGLIDPAFPAIEPVHAVSEFDTWILLIHSDESKAEIRSELSLPARIENGFVARWKERIILANAPYGPAARGGITVSGGDPAISIQVTRRGVAG